MKSIWLTCGSSAALVVAVLSSGCGDFVRGSQSPSQLVITSLLTAPGAGGAVPTTDDFVSGPLLSDVVSNGIVFDDFGQASFRVILRNPGTLTTPTTASSLNDVTITRYTVTYTRSGGPNGQNTPGVDVPHPIEGAVTLTVLALEQEPTVGVVELVRHVAKLEAPLATLASSPEVLTMLAEVTFYGRDQAGNDVSVTGTVQVNFANFN